MKYDEGRDASFAGDRILVNKFAYDPLGKPERFDVIVFKNPNDAKQNYIKRLCGLPGETLRLFHGDIYVKPNEIGKQFEIAQKPPRKLKALLQLVDDTDHVSAKLQAAKMPPCWQPNPGSAWKADATNQTFNLSRSNNESWMRFRNYKPSFNEWVSIDQGRAVNLSTLRPRLISDTYSYNSYFTSNAKLPERGTGQYSSTFRFFDRIRGKNWVGDLGVETDVDIESESGTLLLDLVEGGWKFRCSIDVATGEATISITQQNGQPAEFKEAQTLTAATGIKGPGSHNILFTNFDKGLRLWVDGKVVEFGSTTRYARPANEKMRPYYGGPDDPGDLAPVGIGGNDLQATVTRSKVYRDIYYIAEKDGDWKVDPVEGDYNKGITFERADQLFSSPEEWATAPEFDDRQLADFVLEDFDDDSKDQFFPMGDNSPHSLDGRLWTNNYVERQFLIGEAVFIYYPHPWHAKVPSKEFWTLPLLFYPKFSRMGIIR